jgi:hypothetical protein
MRNIVTPVSDWSYRFECRDCGTTATADQTDLRLPPQLTLGDLHMICPHCGGLHSLDLAVVPRETQRLTQVSERERYRTELRREQDERSGMGGSAGGRLVDGA